MNFKGLNIISVDQFDLNAISKIFDIANEMEIYAQRKRITRVLEGSVLANLFFEPSTRSRVSFGAAFMRLGGSVCDTTGFQFSSMAKGESLYDTSRVISGYADIIVIRHPIEGAVQEFAEAATVPVINGGDGPGEHPTQALLDLYTINKELSIGIEKAGKISIAMIGDLKYGRTVHSLIKLLSLYENISFIFIAPPELQISETIARHLKRKGHSYIQSDKINENLPDADIIYMTRIQQERFTANEEAEKYSGLFCINELVYKKYCKPGAILMHPLPRDSRIIGNELDPDLNSNPNLAIFRQTDNGIPIRMALFALILGIEDQVHNYAHDVNWYSS